MLTISAISNRSVMWLCVDRCVELGERGCDLMAS